jgi:hypothetical protein
MSNDLAPTNTARRYNPALVVADFTATGALLYTGLTPEGLAKVTELARKGYTHASIATSLGISPSAWRRLRTDNPEAAEAFETGRAALDDHYTDKLNHHVDEGNLVALLAAMKFKLGYRDNGPTDNAGNGPQVNITFVNPAAPGDVAKLIGDIPPPEDK